MKKDEQQRIKQGIQSTKVDSRGETLEDIKNKLKFIKRN
jgi:hypothetical protein